MGKHHRSVARAGLAWLALAGFAVLSPPAAAGIRVEVNGVDATLRRNVLALLSVERYKDRDRIEPDAVQRLYRRVDSEARDALKPYGYYNPTIQSTLAQEPNHRDWRVQIEIHPGEPVLVEEVSIIVRGAGATDPVFTRIVARPALVKGKRLEHAAYDKTKSDLQSAAATYGYLDARLLRNELQVDPQQRVARAFLEIETGERYKFGPTTLDQESIREPLLRRYLRYQEGDPFDAGKLLRTQFALDDSRFFSAVEVTTGERDTVNHVVPITVTGKRSRNTYSFGAGYGTDTGVRATISWLDPLVNDRGHRLRVWLELSQIRQNLNARYDVPFGDPVLEKFSVQFLTQSEQTSGAVNTHEDSVTPSVTQNLGRWQRVMSLAFMHTITDDAVNGHLVDDLIVPGITYASVPQGYLGEELFSHTLYAELIGSNKVVGSNSNFLRLDVRSERVLNVTQHWHLFLRGEVGASAVGDFQDLPGTFRFYAGGDRSVRGFGYNELSPVQTVQNADGSVTRVRVGGRHLITGTVEVVRDLPRLMGLAAFTDFGNAINNLGDPLAASVGVGLRWRLPVVTVGFDIAKAVRAPGFSGLPGPRLHINISPQL
jgi:translocation and assembly module TamA